MNYFILSRTFTKNRTYNGFFFILFYLLIGGCVQKQNPNTVDTTTKFSENYKEIALNGKFTVEIPEELETTTTLNDLAETQYLSNHPYFAFLVLNEDLELARSGVMSLNLTLEESDRGNEFLDHYIQFQINTLKTLVKSIQTIDVFETEVDGRRALYYEAIVAFNIGEVKNIFVSGLAVIGESDIYYIYTFHPATNTESYGNVRSHIKNTFKITEEKVKEILEEEIFEEDPEYRGEVEEVSEEENSGSVRPKSSVKRKPKTVE